MKNNNGQGTMKVDLLLLMNIRSETNINLDDLRIVSTIGRSSCKQISTFNGALLDSHLLIILVFFSLTFEVALQKVLFCVPRYWPGDGSPTQLQVAIKFYNGRH